MYHDQCGHVAGVQLESLRAATDAKEITFKVAYGLPLSEQQRWGLYVSEPRNIRETDQPFPEPGLLLLNPDGELVIVDVSNSPFARPDLRILVEGAILVSRVAVADAPLSIHEILPNGPFTGVPKYCMLYRKPS